jgi:signal transduction histidine kinase
MRRLARIPLRVRITLAFAAATGVVLLALAVFLHGRLARELDASLRAGLRSRAGDLAAAVMRGGTPAVSGNSLLEPGDDLAQVIGADGRVVSGAKGYTYRPLIGTGTLARARRAAVTLPRVQTPGDDGPVALVAAPAGRDVVVVGTSLEDRDGALSNLDGLLLGGVPVALLLASLAGYLVARGGLRPIERMRARADAIGTGDLSQRLPAPATDDEVGRLADTLNRMLGRLETGFARERSFVADASHELRTPLARLKAELELASAANRTAPELRAAVSASATEVDVLARLADDLLVLARADSDGLPVRPETLTLADALNDLVLRAPPTARIAVDCPPDLTVEADPLRLRQALDNLLDNALRHGSEDIDLVAHLHEGTVCLHVIDGGPGIPLAMHAKIFDRFTRADAAREGAGAGLGLAIVAAIAAAHGGAAGVANAPEGGADVWISLPSH